PDVITLDIEMPGMDGLSFLEKIMTLRPTPVIIVSGAAQVGNPLSARALQLGAVGCYAKTDHDASFPLGDSGRLANMVREAIGNGGKPAEQCGRSKPPTGSVPNSEAIKAIAIGSSTGGVDALRVLLSGFPADCPPTVIVQHVNARFAPAIAQSLDDAIKPRLVIAESDTVIRPGHVYFAPGGDRHLLLAPAGGKGLRTILRSGDPVSGHLPSVDVLFRSVAETAGPGALGILLTGMGCDGARGLLTMRQRGAHTIVQDEASSVVFGMPRAAIGMGAAGEVLPLTSMARHLFEPRTRAA
ncbi:chemotaxis protein CheB, partial [Erythrobacter sp.]|uniref:chemotaxis protein CheB n=1 Tax=Erythrobacter sp. TaxID=1042 RepID=UPI003C72D075